MIRVLDYLLENRLEDHSKTEIARGADVGWSTLFQYWGRLEARGIVRVTRSFGKTKLYKINEASHFVKLLKKMEFELIRGAMETDAKEARIAVVRAK